jgi:dTDP-4-dehydrorhamnose 3,5-epimerase
VIIDMRPHSPTYLEWVATELSADNRRQLYIPGEFAHGYMTLEDDTEVFYQVAQYYAPQFERGMRYDDPAFKIEWPEMEHLILSEKDKNWPDYQPAMATEGVGPGD